MPRTAEKVTAIAREGEEMTDALKFVLKVAEDKGSISWSDVSDDLTSGQWGRLIEKELLVDADGQGFVLEDPEGVREALSESDPAVISDTDGVTWSKWDKLAAVGSIAMFAGYSMQNVRAAVGETLHVFIRPLAEVLPFYVVILVLAMVTGLYSTILQNELMDTELMGQYQERMQDLKERRKDAKERGDDEALDRIQEEQMEAMGDQMGMFKAQFRPMVWIMLLTIPVFLWMYWMIRDGHLDATGVRMVLPMIGEVSNWQKNVHGFFPTWIVWYFLCSLGFTQVIRKALNVQTSPSAS